MNTAFLIKDRRREFSLSHDALYFTHQETDFGNPLWQNAAHKVLIVRLSPFSDVAESRPHLFLFDEVRRELPVAYIDFAFFPKQRDIPVLEKARLPWLCGIASGRGALDFDILLISNSFTLELINLMPALAHSGIPERYSKRVDGMFPYILLGGSNALASGALLDIRENNIIDAVPDGFFFGEGEHSAGKLVSDILSIRDTAPRATDTAKNLMPPSAQTNNTNQFAEHLFRLAKVHSGFYPIGYTGEIHQAVYRESETDLDYYPILAGENADTARMDISSGCPSFCAFCFESWERKPYREFDASSLTLLSRKLKKISGAGTLELSSYNFNTHTDIVRLISSTTSVFRQVNFMSQRVDILAEHPELIDYEIGGGKRSFTLGIEGASESMRCYFNKELSFPEVRTVFTRLLKNKVREIKLFYIISGLETDEDFNGCEQELTELASLTKNSGYTPSLVLSTGFLVRMPFTPLGYERLIINGASFTAATKRIGNIARQQGFEARSPHYFDEYLATQILALAPPGTNSLLEALYNANIILDGSLPKKSSVVLNAWIQTHRDIVNKLIEEKPGDYAFTFSFVHRPTTSDFLYERYLSAKKRKTEASCFRLGTTESTCSGCGACVDNSEKEMLLEHSIRMPSFKETEELRTIITTKQKLSVFIYRYEISDEEAFAPRQYVEARLMARILNTAPELTDSIYSVKDAGLKKLEAEGRLRNASGRSLVCVTAREALTNATAQALKLVPYPITVTSQNPDIPLRTMRISIHVYTDELVLLENVFGAYLEASAIAYTLQRKGGITEFLIPDKSKKKKTILEARLQNHETGTSVITTECGAKLDLRDFIRLLDKQGMRISMQVEALELE